MHTDLVIVFLAIVAKNQCDLILQGAAATGVTVDYSNDVEIKWTILKKQPTQYDGE